MKQATNSYWVCECGHEREIMAGDQLKVLMGPFRLIPFVLCDKCQKEMKADGPVCFQNLFGQGFPAGTVV